MFTIRGSLPVMLAIVVMLCFAQDSWAAESDYEQIVVQPGQTVSAIAHQRVGRGGNEWRQRYVVVVSPDRGNRTLTKSQYHLVFPGDIVMIAKSKLSPEQPLQVVNQPVQEICSQFQLAERECKSIARRNLAPDLSQPFSGALYRSGGWPVQANSPPSPEPVPTVEEEPQPELVPAPTEPVVQVQPTQGAMSNVSIIGILFGAVMLVVVLSFRDARKLIFAKLSLSNIKAIINTIQRRKNVASFDSQQPLQHAELHYHMVQFAENIHAEFLACYLKNDVMCTKEIKADPAGNLCTLTVIPNKSADSYPFPADEYCQMIFEDVFKKVDVKPPGYDVKLASTNLYKNPYPHCIVTLKFKPTRVEGVKQNGNGRSSAAETIPATR